MNDPLRKFRDRLRIIIILYTFCEKLEDNQSDYYGVFRTEIKIQAIDFLLRYPDFLSFELMDLTDHDSAIDSLEIKQIIQQIYKSKEPEIRVEEMEKFFHGAYESIDDVILFLVSIDFLKYESKKSVDGKKYDRKYFITNFCVEKIKTGLQDIPSAKWYFDRVKLIKKYFSKFSGTELKTRQYKYSEYSKVSYRSYIMSVNEKVEKAFKEKYNEELI